MDKNSLQISQKNHTRFGMKYGWVNNDRIFNLLIQRVQVTVVETLQEAQSKYHH